MRSTVALTALAALSLIAASSLSACEDDGGTKGDATPVVDTLDAGTTDTAVVALPKSPLDVFDPAKGPFEAERSAMVTALKPAISAEF